MSAAPLLVIIDEPGSPRFHMHVVCPRCDRVLLHRTYDVRATDPEGDEAVADATRALAHRCQGH
jgi:hypothetical protein